MKSKKPSKPPLILQKIKNFLKIDVANVDYIEIMVTCSQLNSTQRQRLLSLVQKALNKSAFRKSSNIRVPLVHILVGLMPDSWQTIKKWLTKKRDRYDYEIHFTLFCALDFVPELPNTKRLLKEIPEYVGDYLENVKTDTASAAWAAGDLLGNHWVLEQSLPVLFKAVKKAKYVSGRKQVFRGLEYAYRNTRGAIRRQIMNMLKEISETDRSRQIRESARFIVKSKYLLTL